MPIISELTEQIFSSSFCEREKRQQLRCQLGQNRGQTGPANYSRFMEPLTFNHLHTKRVRDHEMDNSKTIPLNNIIVFGGSLGSLDALRTIVVDLPADLQAAILIVIHSGASSPRMLASILGRYTALPVAYAVDGEPILAARIYLAEPDRHLEVENPGVLRLTDGPKLNHSRPSVDRLFETAAAAFGNRVISVILSGGNADGTQGARVIYAMGGLTLVQDPEDAMAPGMPMSAIKYDHPVMALKAPDIAGQLIDLVSARCPAS
jgi:two-component system chemotaxis response regulator CheB